MCGWPAGWELARSSSTPSKAASPSTLASGAQRSCQMVAADAAGSRPSTVPTTGPITAAPTAAVINVRLFILLVRLPLLPDGELVEVRSTVDRRGGEPDQVGAGGQRRRDGGGRPRVPVTGAGERRRGDQDAVDGDVHRAAGGGAVGVPHRDRCRPGGRDRHRALDVRADLVGAVDEAGTGVAEVVGVHRAVEDGAVLGLVVHAGGALLAGPRVGADPQRAARGVLAVLHAVPDDRLEA